LFFFFSCGTSARFLVMASPLRGFTITLIGRITLGRTPLGEWSARYRDLYLSTHNTHKRQTSNPQSQPASGRRPTP